MSPARRLALSALALAAAGVVAGCLAEITSGGASVGTSGGASGSTTTVGYVWWVWVGTLAVSVAVLGVGLAAWKKQRALAGGFLAVGLVGAGLVAPSLALDRTVVAPGRVTMRTGIYGLTAGADIDLGRVTAVRLVSEQSRAWGGGAEFSEALIFVTDTGESRIPLGGPSAAKHRRVKPLILGAIRDAGKAVEDARSP